MNACCGFHRAGECASGSGSLTIGSTAVGGGTAGRVLFEGAGAVLADNANFTWDDTDNQLVLGAGSASKPSLSFVDDGLGLYRSASNVLSASLSGALALSLGATGPDADVTLAVGRLLIDSRFTDQVTLSHRDQTGTLAYGFLHNASGATVLNCTSGQTITLRHAGTVRMTINTTGLGLYGATPVAQQNVTGSRSGATVTVLANLLTALAALGAITDGTTA